MNSTMNPNSKLTLVSKHLFPSKLPITFYVFNSAIHSLITSQLGPIINQANYYIYRTDANIVTATTSTPLQAFKISVTVKSFIYQLIVIGLIHKIESRIKNTIGTKTVNTKYVTYKKYIPNVSSIDFSRIIYPILIINYKFTKCHQRVTSFFFFFR